MGNVTLNIVNAPIEIYCIVLGATDSLLQVKLPNGYEFRRVKTNELQINKNIRNLSGQLLPQYHPSNLTGDDANPEFICIYKSDIIVGNFDVYEEKERRAIEKIIMLLHLFKEGYISIYGVYYCTVLGVFPSTVIDYNGFIRKGEKWYEVLASEVVELESFLCLEQPIYDRLYELTSICFNSTKFIDVSIQLINLVTVGEMLVLNSNDGKGIPFSKRIALLIERTNEDRIATFQSLRKVYSLRSDWVHEGICDTITLCEVNSLRVIISRAIKEYIARMRSEMIGKPGITLKEIKTIIIKELIDESKRLGDAFFPVAP